MNNKNLRNSLGVVAIAATLIAFSSCKGSKDLTTKNENTETLDTGKTTNDETTETKSTYTKEGFETKTTVYEKPVITKSADGGETISAERIITNTVLKYKIKDVTHYFNTKRVVTYWKKYYAHTLKDRTITKKYKFGTSWIMWFIIGAVCATVVSILFGPKIKLLAFTVVAWFRKKVL